MAEQMVTLQLVLTLEVADHRLDGRAPAQQCLQRPRQPLAPRDVDRDICRVMRRAFEAPVNKGFFRSDLRRALDLRERAGASVAPS